jgi:hypothetical protein
MRNPSQTRTESRAGMMTGGVGVARLEVVR